MSLVAVALGSNLGDRRGHLAWAVERLGQVLTDVKASRVIETAPVGVPTPQPDYLNAVVVGETSLQAAEVLEVLLGLERERGRARSGYRAARSLDLDLIFHGRDWIDSAELTVPHPRFRERGFVLVPLAELVPDWIDPVTGKTVAALLADLEAKEKGA